jgi:hypothetical protein
MNGLFNKGSGSVCIHANEPHVLGVFDQQVDDKLMYMIADGSTFTDNFKRSRLDMNHVVFRVKHRERILSTLFPNIKLATDKGLTDPTQYQLQSMIKKLNDLPATPIAVDEETEDATKGAMAPESAEQDVLTKPLTNPRREEVEMRFVEDHVVCSRQSIVFQESQTLQAKRVDTRQDLKTQICETLPKYVSAFARTGGSVFWGVLEETIETKTERPPDDDDLDDKIKKLIAQNPGIRFRGNKVVMLNEKKSGKFLCEGVELSQTDQKELRCHERQFTPSTRVNAGNHKPF